DPLALTPKVAWLDHDADVLSAWDPVHFGMDETAKPVRLNLRERQMFLAGAPGTGKSSGQTVIVSHFANGPDAVLVLIDPNQVQFSPWKDRALAFATDDPVDAIGVLQLVRDEVKSRLAFLDSLPGVQRKLTPELSREHGLPLWLLAIDELAFHTSVV